MPTKIQLLAENPSFKISFACNLVVNLVFCLSHAQVIDWLQFSIFISSLLLFCANFVFGLIPALMGLII